jgi:predicted nucleic acid-binding Zn ribbon protein
MRCFVCRAEIPIGAPVYRHKTPHGYGNSWIDSVCADCIRKADESLPQSASFPIPDYYTRQFGPSQPCATCSRPVFRYIRYKVKDTVFCSEECQRAISNTRARLKRVRDPKRCLKCGRVFAPTRTDSKYCSVACKQSAYRWRLSIR